MTKEKSITIFHDRHNSITFNGVDGIEFYNDHGVRVSLTIEELKQLTPKSSTRHITDYRNLHWTCSACTNTICGLDMEHNYGNDMSLIKPVKCPYNYSYYRPEWK